MPVSASSSTPRPLPPALAQLVSQAGALGLSGSRLTPRPSSDALAALLAHVAPSCAVHVGDAPGIDAQACRLLHLRRHNPDALTIHRAADRRPGLLAARSIRCVKAVAAGGQDVGQISLWCAFPASPCPPALASLGPCRQPSKAFGGFGSGTWSSLALALGLGLAAVVYLPPAAKPPPGWSLLGVGKGWHLALPPTPLTLSL